MLVWKSGGMDLYFDNRPSPLPSRVIRHASARSIFAFLEEAVDLSEGDIQPVDPGWLVINLEYY